MVRIKLDLPVDSTFLSQIIYGGIVYIISRYGISFNAREAVVEDNFLKDFFGKLDDYKDIRIVLTGNDNVNTELFKKFNLNSVRSKKVLNDLFSSLQENSTILETRSEISLKQTVRGKDVLFDIDSKKDGISFQLLKVDRYTGFTSTDLNYTAKQLTSYFSKELILLSLVGIYSSYITTSLTPSSKGLIPTYYFLFLSPEETLDLLSKGDLEFLKKCVSVKNIVREVIKEIISFSQTNEMLLLELMLNVKLHESMEKHNLEKISTTMFKLCPEGQTYKIYENIPLTIFRETLFNYKIKEYYGPKYLNFIKSVQFFLNDGHVRSALMSFTSRNKRKEADSILLAIQHLYKFVTLGDTQHLFNFMREILNAHEKIKDKEGWSPYLNILKHFPY